MPDLETSLTYCTYCPKLCRHVCPVGNAEARETLTPQTKMATMRLYRIGRLADPIAVEPLYGCTGCGACTEACKHQVTAGRHLFTGRADAEARGDGHPALADLGPRVRLHAERAAAAAREAAPGRTSVEADLALLPSCDDPALAAPTLAIADRAGAALAVAEVGLGCGGYPLLAGGFPDAFRLHAESVAKQLRRHKRVVVACPACAWAMKQEYPAHGVPLAPEVVPLAAWLAEVAGRLTVGKTRAPTFYHDPCYLGRHLGVYDAPRAVLAQIGGVREFSRNRGESECSGGGGVLGLTMPETADAIADHRLEEVREAGAVEVATACATCKKRLTRDGIAARDLVELLEEATRPAGAPPDA